MVVIPSVYRYFTLEGVFSLFYILLVQGPIFTGLALLFHLDEFLLAIAASLPSMMQIFQLLASPIANRFGKRRLLVNIFNGIGRFTFSALVIFMIMRSYSPWIFLTFMAVSQIFVSIAGSIWASWMKDLIPEEVRGKVFATRNLFISVGNAGIIYLYSYLADHFSFGFEMIMVLSILGSFMSIYMMTKIPDVPIKSTGKGFPIRVALKDENFRNFLLFYFYWSFAVSFSSPYYHYHLIKDLKLSYTYIAHLSVITSFVAIFTYRLLSKVSDRVGHKTIAEIAIVSISLISFMWFFMNPQTYTYLTLADAIATGVFWPMMNLALLVLPMEVAFKSDPVFFGLSAATASAGGVMGSVIGGKVAKFLSNYHFQFEGFEIFGIQFIFLIAFVLRGSAVFLLSRVKVKRYTPIRGVILGAVHTVFRRSLTRVFDRMFAAYVIYRKAMRRKSDRR